MLQAMENKVFFRIIINNIVVVIEFTRLRDAETGRI